MAEYCYHDDVIRTQISLSERQMEALRQLARQRNVSMAQFGSRVGVSDLLL